MGRREIEDPTLTILFEVLVESFKKKILVAPWDSSTKAWFLGKKSIVPFRMLIWYITCYYTPACSFAHINN